MTLVLNADSTFDRGKGTVGQPLDIPLATSVVPYQAHLAGLNGAGHATLPGRGVLFEDAINLVPLGGHWMHQGGDLSKRIGTGNLTGTAGGTVDDGSDTAGAILQIDVAGATSAAAANGRWVYCSDAITYTLARPTTGAFPIGFVIRWITGTRCIVLLFDFQTLLALSMAGVGRQTLCLGNFVLTGAAGNLLTGWVAPFHGNIIEAFAVPTTAPAGSGGSVTLNLEIGGTNVTGGVMTVATGDSVGDKKSGTSITGANRFHEGDLVDLELAVASPLSAGATNVYMVVEAQPGT